MLLLAVETSCDETSVAVLRDDCVLANAVSSQVKLHEEYGGVVPELASREHLRNLMPVARQALGQANVTPQQLDAVAATRGPGLPGALLVGLRAAQGMAFALASLPYFMVRTGMGVSQLAQTPESGDPSLRKPS